MEYIRNHGTPLMEPIITQNGENIGARLREGVDTYQLRAIREQREIIRSMSVGAIGRRNPGSFAGRAAERAQDRELASLSHLATARQYGMGSALAKTLAKI